MIRATPSSWQRLGLLASMAVVLAACGNSGPDLKAHYQETLPPNWTLESFSVEAKEEVGTKVAPEVHSRFKAEVAPTTDLVQKVGTLADTDVLKVTVKKGEDNKVFGIARSRYIGEEWKTRFELSEAPNFGAGKPASEFAAKQVVVGSSAYRNLLKSTKDSLEDRDKKLEEKNKNLMAAIASFNTLRQDLQTKANESSQALNQTRQQIQQQRYALQQQEQRETQALRQTQLAEQQKRTSVFKQTLDQNVAELDKNYRLDGAKFQAERIKLNEARTASRNKLRADYDRDIAAARKTQDRAGMTLYLAQAQEKLRADNAAVDAKYNEEVAQIRAKETELSNQRRARLEEFNTAYRQQVEEVRLATVSDQQGPQGEIKQQTQSQTAKLDEEMKAATDAHQALMRQNNNQINAKQSEIRELQNQIYQEVNTLRRDAQLIDQLEKQAN